MIARTCYAVVFCSIFLQNCAVPETKVTQSDIANLERKPFVANNFILSKVTKFNADKILLAIETARIDTDENEIYYFSEDRKNETFHRGRLKYSNNGLLLYRNSLDRDGQLNWVEVFQYDDQDRLKSSTINFKEYGASVLHVQFYQYDAYQLISRTVTTSPAAKLIESDEYSYLPTGHLDYRLSKRIVGGKEIRTWAKFEYDVTNRIDYRIYGEGSAVGSEIAGFEYYSYDSNDNLTVMTEKDVNDKTVFFTRYEYFYTGEPAYNRNQHFLRYNQ